jgi:tetratricopeptide (TPR) repeat protein
MATKTKISETPAQAPDSSVEKVLAEGLEHLNAGRLPEAAQAFEHVLAEAGKQERLHLGHTARGYLLAITARLEAQKLQVKDGPELAAQSFLNHGDSAAALAILEPAVAAQPERAILHYLVALAQAQADQAQASADALAKALALDSDLLFQFRLDSEFDGVRHAGPFAVLLRG